MKSMPPDCKMSFKLGVFTSAKKPRLIVELTVESAELDMKVIQFLHGGPFLLRLRMAAARNRCLRMIRKMKKFKERNGI